MHFYFDESGSFTVPREPTRHSAGVVVGVAIPEHAAPELERRYRDFASTLEKDERERGEPKGARLCSKHRKAFGDLLRRFWPNILVTPVTLDLSSLAGTDYSSIGSGIADSVSEWIPQMEHDGPKERLDLVARQIRNLSDNQTLRTFSMAYCFHRILAYSIMFLSHGEFESAWEDLHFVVDRIHPQDASREEQVFSVMVMAWISAWSEDEPIGLIPEIHTASHTIVRKYRQSKGLELGSMLRNRITWQNSTTCWGLQIADMAAAIIGDAVRNPSSSATLDGFVRVMRSSCMSAANALNIFTPIEVDESYRDKYQPLADALTADQKRRARSSR